VEKQKKKKKRGFSLIELLGVVVILGILLMIAIPQVYKFIRSGKDSYYKNMEREASVAASNYVDEYKALLPRQIGHVSEVYLDELVESKFIDELKDENGDKCTGKVIIEKVKKNDYEYYACIECGTNGKYYKSKNTNCSRTILDNKYPDSDLYYLVAETQNFDLSQMDIFDSKDAHVKVYKKISETESEPVLPEGEYLEGTPKQIKMTDLGEKEVIYYYHGATLVVKVTGKDDIPPSKPEVTITKANDTKMYNGKWCNDDVLVTFKSTDYAAKGIKGSGVDHYEVSEDGINFVRIDGNNEILTEEGIYTKYVRAVDRQGNISEVNTYTVKIDKTKPTVSKFSVASTTANYNSRDVNVMIKVDDTYGEVDSYCYLIDTTDTSKCRWHSTNTGVNNVFVHNFPESDYNTGKAHNIYAFGKDKAGNISTARSTYYAVYRYCTSTVITGRSGWGSCSADCDGGTQYRTVYYRDNYFASHTCPSGSESQSCNTESCPHDEPCCDDPYCHGNSYTGGMDCGCNCPNGDWNGWPNGCSGC